MVMAVFMARLIMRIPSMITPWLFITGLVLMAGCQAQAVKPQPEAASSTAAQASKAKASITSSVDKFFDEHLQPGRGSRGLEIPGRARGSHAEVVC